MSPRKRIRPIRLVLVILLTGMIAAALPLVLTVALKLDMTADWYPMFRAVTTSVILLASASFFTAGRGKSWVFHQD